MSFTTQHSGGDAGANDWRCAKCTYHNALGAPQCEMCHTRYALLSQGSGVIDLTMFVII